MEMPRSLKRKRHVLSTQGECRQVTVDSVLDRGRQTLLVRDSGTCRRMSTAQSKLDSRELKLRLAQQVAPYLQVANAAGSTKGRSCMSIPNFVRLQVTYQNKEKLARTRNLVVLKASTGHVSELARYLGIVQQS